MSVRHALLSTTFLSAIVLAHSTLPARAVDALTVNGINSPYTVSGSETKGEVKIGTTLAGQQLIIEGPTGNLTSAKSWIGNGSGSNSAQVKGTWLVDDEILALGNNGGGNSLSIEDGGDVTADSIWIGFKNGSSNNSVTVDGFGSSLNGDIDVTVGYASTGNTLTVTGAGALVKSYNGYMGWAATANNNTATIEGATWTVENSLQIGHLGSGNRLNITQGGQVTAGADMLLGYEAGSSDNSVVISGTGSTLTVNATKTLYVGRSGNNNTLTVEKGGTLLTNNARIGGDTDARYDANNNSVTVDGEGSKWTLTGTLRIGGDSKYTDDVPTTHYYDANDNALYIRNGGTVEMTVANKTLTIGTVDRDADNKLVVTGEGSSLSLLGNIVVGSNASEALRSLLEVTDGGSIVANGPATTVSVGSTSTVKVGPAGSLHAVGLSFKAGGNMDVAIDHERPVDIAFSGTANLTGADFTGTVGANGVLSNRYDILSAGTVLNEFATDTVTGLSSALSYKMNYSGTEVWLTFEADLGGSQPLSENQQNVADTLDEYFNAGGILAPGFGGLFTLTGDDLDQALSEVSGEVGATGGAKAVEQSTNAFLGLMLRPRTAVEGGEMAAARVADLTVQPTADVISSPAGGWSMWGSVYGGTASLPGDDALGSHDTTTDILGIATGWDYAYSGDATVGFAIAGGGTRWDLSDGLGSGESTFVQVGAHGTQRFGASYLSLAGAYAWHVMSTERTVNISGSEDLEADFDAGNLAGRVEGGHRFGSGMGFTPYAALQAQAVYMPDYTEDGGDVAVSYDEETATAVRSELGLRLDTVTDSVRLEAGLAWAHDWNSDGAVNASFQQLPGTSFIVNGAESPDDLALVNAAATFGLGRQTSLSAGFDGEFGLDYANYGGSLTLAYSW